MTDKNTFYNMLKSNAESQPDAVAGEGYLCEAI